MLQICEEHHVKNTIILLIVNVNSQYLCDLFNSNDSMHSCNPRNSSQLRATKSRTAYFHHSFTVFGLNLWNSLPRNIQNSTSLSSFKSVSFTFIGAKPQFQFNVVLLVLRILILLTLLSCKYAFKL